MRPETAISVLVGLSRDVADAEDPVQVARLLADTVALHTKAAGIAVYAVTEDGGVVLAEVRGWEAARLPDIDGSEPDEWLGHLMELSPLLARGFDPEDLEKLSVLPLASGGGLYGALVLAWEQPPEPWSMTLAMGLADTAAIGLDRAYRTRELVRSTRALAAKQEELVRNESLRRMGQLAATVAHEVRNPLASFSGVMQVLRTRFPAESEENRMAGKVLTRLADLDRLVMEILQFARPRTITRTETNLCSLLDDVAALARRDPAAGRVDIVLRCEADAMWTVDPAMLRHLLSNLLQNAIFAVEGAGRIELSCARVGDTFELSVADTGPGIPEEQRGTIFDPFVTTKVHGSGLGLAVARQVAEAHNGSITYQPSPSGGAMFVVRLGR